MTEAEKYQHLMRETSNDVTMIYVHGGGYW